MTHRLGRRTLLGVAGLAGTGVAAGLSGCGAEKDDPKESTVPAGKYPYGDDPSQFGELTMPDDPAAAPGIAVVIHGGFWQATYDLDLGRPLAADLAARGWIAWNVEYRRVGNGGGTPETFDDVRAALDHLGSLDLGEIDPAQATVALIGHSAGGHLAAWAGDHEYVDAVVSQAGVLDLGAADEENLGQGAVASLLGHGYSAADAEWDPISLVPLEVPVWCVHGTDDQNVPVSQSEDYVAAASAAGARAELVSVDGDHFTLIKPESDAWASVITILESL